MPRLVSELSQGQNYEFSADQGGLAASAARVFRILLTSPSEFIDIPVACSAPIGSEHPRSPGVFCTSFSGVYEGESRMVILATFNYASTPSADSSGGGGGGADPKSQPPDVRPASWYTTTSLVEVPAFKWQRIELANQFDPDSITLGPKTPIHNPVGDLYEGITTLTPITTIYVEQWNPIDPTLFSEFSGSTNGFELKIGSLVMPRRTVMFRGVQARPKNEAWGDAVYRGWDCTYEFLYRKNVASYDVPSDFDLISFTEPIGWDVLQPQSGFNVFSFNPAQADNSQDPFGQPLRHNESSQIIGADGNPLAEGGTPLLPIGMTAGEKVRAMVRISSGNFIGQRPSSQPVPMNDDGTARIDTATPKVYVYRYKVTEEVDFLQLLKIRI
jgi:hypothetical protein